jgi:hypothetical protein
VEGDGDGESEFDGYERTGQLAHEHWPLGQVHFPLEAQVQLPEQEVPVEGVSGMLILVSMGIGGDGDGVCVKREWASFLREFVKGRVCSSRGRAARVHSWVLGALAWEVCQDGVGVTKKRELQEA